VWSQAFLLQALGGKLLDNMMKWSLVGLLIEAADSYFSLDSTLVGYSQAFLMILGLQSNEAEKLSKLAAQHLQ
jgi:hypothetical protein